VSGITVRHPRAGALVSGIAFRHPRAGALVSGIAFRHPRAGALVSAITFRHPRAGGDPGARPGRRDGPSLHSASAWIPAFAGMTIWATQQDLAPGSPPSRTGVRNRFKSSSSPRRRTGVRNNFSSSPRRRTGVRNNFSSSPRRRGSRSAVCSVRRGERAGYALPACVLVAQARADVQVSRSCSGKEPALNSFDGGLALPAPSPTLLLLLHAQEQPRAQLGEVRIGCEPGAAFLLRDNSLAQPARFIADTSARRRESSPWPSAATARIAGQTALLDPRLRGDDEQLFLTPVRLRGDDEQLFLTPVRLRGDDEQLFLTPVRLRGDDGAYQSAGASTRPSG
jgi:hypothetical protein